MSPAPFETGLLRPPSEARSLLVRVARNCPWNRCSFCPAYKGEPYSLRSAAEILADLDGMRACLDAVSPELAEATRPRARELLLAGDPRAVDALGPLASWVRAGMETAFLQDADALSAPVDTVETVLKHMKTLFPRIGRVTIYGRAHTLARRSVEELLRLREAGLDRVHVGMETGSETVMKLVNKGSTAERQRLAGARVKAAGLELCCYIMPGLGGREFSEEHARESGRLIADVDPHHTRLRTCFVLPGTPLAERHATGTFVPHDEEGVVREIRLFLEQIAHARTALVSDHRINLLLELNGRLPDEADRLFAIIDRFLSLGADDRKLFIVGRRLGRLHLLDELERPGARDMLRPLAEGFASTFVAPAAYLL